MTERTRGIQRVQVTGRQGGRGHVGAGLFGDEPHEGVRDNRVALFFFFQAEDGIRDGRVTGVQTCALPIFEAIAGHDPADSTSVNSIVPRYSEMLADDIKQIRIGVPKEYFVSGVAAEVECRSEERRVGKEGRSGRWRVELEKEVVDWSGGES